MIIKFFDKQENLKGKFTDVSLFKDFIIEEYHLSMFDTESFLLTPIKEFLGNCKKAKSRFKIEYKGLPND